jgi:hypothetical protein
MKTDREAWIQADPDDLWVYDKLILSRKLGYVCGPADVPVPYSGEYIVRPITNILGMSIGARKKWISRDTFYLEPGTFWCEVFKGRHLTYDFIDGKQAICYEGFLAEGSLCKFLKWQKTNDRAVVPNFVLDLSKKYGHINIECKGDKIIELHLRPNPDWIQYNADVLIPKWSDTVNPGLGYRYVTDEDSGRLGFWIK